MKGLDFGTSTTLVSESTPARTAVTPIGKAEKWIPSLVGFDGSGIVAGEDALFLPEEQILRSAKRAITRRAKTFSVFNGTTTLEVDADTAIVEILRTVSLAAEDAFVSLGGAEEVRLGCPAMWEGDQRRRLVRLAKEAGISVSENTVVDEPIAAGLAWVNRQTRAGNHVRGKLLVFDMGGGTLDVAVLHVDGQPTPAGSRRIPPIVSVQSSLGIDRAGDSLDEAMFAGFIEHLRFAGFDLHNHPAAGELDGWVRRAARLVKEELSDLEQTTVVIGHPTIATPNFTYSRVELEAAFAAQMTDAVERVRLALRSALMAQVKSPEDQRAMSPELAKRMTDEELFAGVKYVVLAGGMAKIPVVRETLGRLFGGDRIWLGAGEDPSRPASDSAEMVALGLSYHEDSDRMNLHRPGFDFVLEWQDPASSQEGHVVVYSAYSPLYTPEQAILRDSTKFTWKPEGTPLPRRGEALLTVRALNGERLDFSYRGERLPGIRMAFGSADFTVSLEPNGRVFWRDGGGREGAVRVAQWPVIRGVKQEAIVIEDLPQHDAGRWSVESLPYHLKPYD